MSLPVSALSDLELIHYAPVDDSAKEELTRRLGTFVGIELFDEVKRMDAQLLEYQRKEDAAAVCYCDCDDLGKEKLKSSINRVRELLKDHKAMDPDTLSKAVESALKEIPESN
jgi:hypothetical protein